ncbi:hypothetical protein BC941DRAFT_470221 [Chlamydoabsidia padenii]|nr:hypothetical protein BC941DRAFT_470221 [Chlamydoabsidia padenii]
MVDTRYDYNCLPINTTLMGGFLSNISQHQELLHSFRDNIQQCRFVGEILSAPNYFIILNITKKTPADDLGQAYIKFVPAYPRTTECFQLLSLAYESFSDPFSASNKDLAWRRIQMVPYNWC